MFLPRSANHFQVLEFGRMRWENKDPETSAYFCIVCEGRIENHQKTVMLEHGEWRTTAAGDGRTAGFHLPSYYSPVGWFSFADAARMFISASTKALSSCYAFSQTRLTPRRGRSLEKLPIGRGCMNAPKPEALPYNRKVSQAGLFLTAGADDRRTGSKCR
ncbi:MAG: phage terminase large subunit family protein [Bryobacteraceae bacterium]